MACGTPVVLRKAEGLAELAEGGAGLAVERGDGAAFAEAIAALLAGDRAAQRRAARARAEEADWERVLPGLLDHYRRLLGREAAAPAREPRPLAAPAVPPAP